MSRLAAVAFATAALVFSALICAPPGHADPAVDSCVIIDTDFDIDDMMSIPTVLGARHVAAIVTTEGYTLPALGAAAVTRLVTEPGQRAIPVVVGAATGRPEADIAASFGDYVLDYRALMHRLNNSLPAALPPVPATGDYLTQVADAVAGCPRVDVLVLGPFSSFANYGAAIRSRIGRVVITGRPPHGDPQLKAGESFNCVYDQTSCDEVFNRQIPGLDHAFVDVPRSDCDTTPNRAGCAGTVYGPTLAMARGLTPAGLPGTLRRILLDDPDTWALDTWEQSGYGGRTMFWDQSTVLALLDPGAFRLVGAHWETLLSPQDFQRRWVEFTNLSVSYR